LNYGLDAISAAFLYQSLKNSFVIFICTKDPFHYGQSIYHFRNTCREIPELAYEEGRETIYLNAAGSRDGLSPELKNLLDYIAGKEVNDAYTAQLNQKVFGVITNKDWRAEYMTFEMKLMDKYQEGLKLGQEQGLERGIEQGIKQGLEQGRLQERSKQLQINRINKYLMSHNMAEDVMKALGDPDYQELLFKKYQDVVITETDQN